MKLKITLKDPDWDQDTIKDAARDSLADILEHLSEDEQEVIIEKREEVLKAAAAKWFEDQEYLTIEIDTDLDTCVVIRPKR